MGLPAARTWKAAEEARAQIRVILDGVRCEGISHTAYGLVQAAGEWLDHVRRHRSHATHLTRTLLKPEPLKAKAVQLVHEVIGAGA